MTLAKTLGTAVLGLGLISLGMFGNAVAETSAPLLDKVPPETVLTVGDPVTQKALEVSGLIKELTFEVKWANLSGGPQTSEAFRAHALDVGSVAEIPSIFANWNNLPVRNIAYRERKDPIANPIYRFGIAPGVDVKSLVSRDGTSVPPDLAKISSISVESDGSPVPTQIVVGSIGLIAIAPIASESAESMIGVQFRPPSSER